MKKMATEKWLIDANALLENSDVFTMHTKEYGSIEVIPVDVVGDAPAVDAVEVVHGSWRWCGSDRWNDAYQCSNCGKIAMNDSNYCPNCGAKMDGEFVRL